MSLSGDEFIFCGLLFSSGAEYGLAFVIVDNVQKLITLYGSPEMSSTQPKYNVDEFWANIAVQVHNYALVKLHY